MAFCRFPKVHKESCQRDGSRPPSGPHELWAQGHRKKGTRVGFFLAHRSLSWKSSTGPILVSPFIWMFCAMCVREIDHLLDAHFHEDFKYFRQCAGDLTVIFFSPIPETSSVWSNPRSVQPCCTAFSARDVTCHRFLHYDHRILWDGLSSASFPFLSQSNHNFACCCEWRRAGCDACIATRRHHL